jgi:hypothetical protein
MDKLIKPTSRGEVFLIRDGQRHWIPDPQTLTSQWSWDLVETLPDDQVYVIPMGDPIPSVATGRKFPDGCLLASPPDAPIYVVLNGARRWIPDPQTFNARGYDWNDVEAVSATELGLIPLGTPIPSVKTLSVDTGNVFLGNGHYMHTTASLTAENGAIGAITRTWTITMFGGYHGGVSLLLVDSNGALVHPTPVMRYGVDGTAIGQSDRTDAWQNSMPQQDTGRVDTIHVIQAWDPDGFVTIFNKWKEAGQGISALANAIGSVAKLFSGSSGGSGGQGGG